jgi:hypothetical protein
MPDTLLIDPISKNHNLTYKWLITFFHVTIVKKYRGER